MLKLGLYALVFVMAGSIGVGQLHAQSDLDDPTEGITLGPVRVNTLGFFPTSSSPKFVTVAGASAGAQFKLLKADGAFVKNFYLNGGTYNPDTGGTVYVGDFSSYTTPGTYYIYVPSIDWSSPKFKIDAYVYNDAFWFAAKSLTLARCSMAVSQWHNGVQFSHGACHLEDGYQNYDNATGTDDGKWWFRDAEGGWHDAGDYNKYTPNTAYTAAILLKAWEHHRTKIDGVDLNLPNDNPNLPDFLEEIQWGLKWMLKMQRSDGAVWHKLSQRGWVYWGMPEYDLEVAGDGKDNIRYYQPWSSFSTADFTAVMSLAARWFYHHDLNFSNTCKAAADKSWSFLVNNPGTKYPYGDGVTDPFVTGKYYKSDKSESDADYRAWAAIEMWERTGVASQLQAFENIAANWTFVPTSPDWDQPRAIAIGTYLTSARSGRNTTIVNNLKNLVVNKANELRNNAMGSTMHGYGRPNGTAYSWGANGRTAGLCYILEIANRISPNADYRKTKEHALSFLFGRNYHQRSYVTRIGYYGPEQPHDRRRVLNGTDRVRRNKDPRDAALNRDYPQTTEELAWPGLLISGSPNNGQQKRWYDNSDSASRGEIAINWNANLTYALADFEVGH